MSKAKEFAALAEDTTPGTWRADVSESERSGYVEVTRIRLGNGGHTGQIPCRDADFVVWCANNREIIARALRLLEAVENPEKCAEFVHARMVAHQHDYSPMNTADRVASALLEVSK